MIDNIAAALLGVTAWLRRRRIALAAGSLVVILLAGSTYLVLGTLRIDPTKSMIRVRIPLAESGGLLPNQDVTLRGVPIGRVESVGLTDSGVVAHMRLNTDTEVPENVTATVKSVSAVGEQYIDLVPPDNGEVAAKGVLRDGSDITVEHTAIGQDIALGDADAAADLREGAAIAAECLIDRSPAPPPRARSPRRPA